MLILKKVRVRITDFKHGSYQEKDLNVLKFNVGLVIQVIEYDKNYFKSFNCSVVFLIHKKDCVIVN